MISLILLGYKRGNITHFAEEGIFIKWETEEIDQDNFILQFDRYSVVGNIINALEILE